MGLYLVCALTLEPYLHLPALVHRPNRIELVEIDPSLPAAENGDPLGCEPFFLYVRHGVCVHAIRGPGQYALQDAYVMHLPPAV